MSFLNPFRKVAELHTAGLDFCINEYLKSHEACDDKEVIVEAVCKYVHEIVPNISKSDITRLYADVSNSLNNSDSETDDRFIRFLNEKVSEKAIECFKEMLEFKGENDDQVIEFLNNKENEVYNSTDLNSLDKEYLLLFIEIGRSSSNYHKAQIAKETTGLKNLIQRIGSKLRNVIVNWPWHSDAKSAVEAGLHHSVIIALKAIASGGVTITYDVVVEIAGHAVAHSLYDFVKEIRTQKRQKETEDTIKRGNPPPQLKRK